MAPTIAGEVLIIGRSPDRRGPERRHTGSGLHASAPHRGFAVETASLRPEHHHQVETAAIGSIMKDGPSGLGGIRRSRHDGAREGPATRVRRFEIAFSIFAVLVYLGVHVGLNGGDDGELPPPDAFATVSQAAVLLLGAGLVIQHREACSAALIRLWPFALLLVLAATSSLWSQAPEASLRRSATLATLMMFTVYAHAVLGTVLICRIQVAAVGIAAVASFVMAVLVPSSGFDVGGYAGAVRGVFTQKNSFGDAMVAGMVALSYLVLNRRRLAWTDLLCMAFALGTAVLAQATTSLLLCLIIAGMTIGVLLLMEASVLAIFGLLTGLVAASVAVWLIYMVPIDVFDVVGKDSTLTGRAGIWTGVRHVIADGPILGYGYSAFWLPESHTAQDAWAAIGWLTPSAHSGYFETQLELGVPGLVLLSGLGLATLYAAATAWRAGRSAAAGWACVLLTVIAILNYDESSLPRPDIHLLQWMLVFAACRVGMRTRGEHRAVCHWIRSDPSRPRGDDETETR